MVEFKEWPKIPRGSGETITITEKIDGTNACIIVEINAEGVPEVIGVQSRSRLITPEDDNYGFAGWVERNKEDLALKLGEGYHYGEWAGNGIQKNPHNIEGKKLFLFNSNRWQDGRQERPIGVECVPVLYEGAFTKDTINAAMNTLWEHAKQTGYHPEGIVVWYHKTKRYEKYTFENANGKWASA
jgi:hypothetical protein